MRFALLLTVVAAVALMSACTKTTEPEPLWKRPDAQKTSISQVQDDQDQCRKKANQETAQRLSGNRPGPENMKMKRALFFQCMEEKGWGWQGEQSFVPRREMTK